MPRMNLQRVLAKLVLLLIGLSAAPFPAPAFAQGAFDAPPMPSCKAFQPEIFATKPTYWRAQKVDGAKLKSPKDLVVALARANPRTLRIIGGDFSGWDFRGQKYSNLCFEQSKLRDSNWSSVSASGIGFVASDLQGADLSNAKMRDILVRDSDLANVNASGADWSSGQIDGGWGGSLEKLNLDRANMTGFVFRCGITIGDGCPVSRAGMRAQNANFTAADVHSFWLSEFDLNGAVFNRTIVGPRQVKHLSKIAVQGPIILRGGDAQVRLLPNDWLVLGASIAQAKAANGTPSFRCSKARSVIEKLICGNGARELRQKDRELAALYKQARAKSKTVRKSQKAWLKQRNACAARNAALRLGCLSKQYDMRLGTLSGIVGKPEFMVEGASFLFIEAAFPVSDSFRVSPLFGRLKDVYIGASRAEAIISVNVDGSISAIGSAVGANAHHCSIDAKDMKLDSKTGYYAGQSKEGEAIPVLRLSGRAVSVYDGGASGNELISCGARARFPSLQHINVPTKVFAKFSERLSEEY